MEHGSSVPQKIRTTLRSGKSTSEYAATGNESRAFKRYLHSHAHGSVIHNSKRQKQPESPLMEMRRHKMYVHTCIITQP